MSNNRLLLAILLLFFFFSNVNAQEKTTYPKNEFRAVWIATVVNIDWPKYSLDSIAKQKTDFIEILDTYKKLNYNAVIVQIRSVGDAFYSSELAPWSRFVTGREGMAPPHNFDFLEWMIAESHARGFDFHAWLNPYRATMDLNKEILSPQHDLFLHPDWMIKYGGKYYYNPALPQVQAHLTAVVQEVVDNYDIDAIHFDDYFYPYTIPGEKFNDSESFQKYGNGLSLADWRRANVTHFVKTISKTIKTSKPWVQFGISPFGVWRNKSVDPRGSDTNAGQTNYDDLFADPLAWMETKDIDYIMPQLYWSMNHPKAPYGKLLKWWSENAKNVAVYIGNSSYKIRTDSDKNWNNPLEIPNQIELTRIYANVQGNGVFSAKCFMNKNQDVVQILKENQYKYPAIPLAVPNLKRTVTQIPKVETVTKDLANTTFFIHFPEKDPIRYVVVYAAKSVSEINVNNASQIIDKIAFLENNETICLAISNLKLENLGACALSFIDFYGNESKPTILDLNKIIKK
jgi:uncharacterized lipoprotein YddW (UPF0748 family)